jgi:hypothetical protein
MKTIYEPRKPKLNRFNFRFLDIFWVFKVDGIICECYKDVD